MRQYKTLQEKNNSKKICFAASSGGHFEQLMMLKPLMQKYEHFIITEKTLYSASNETDNIYFLKQVNRKEFSVFPNMLVNFFVSFYIFLKEKPDVIISTGVLATIPICIIAKLFCKKLIYIESFAKISSPTFTGRLLYFFSNQFYVQWEEMLTYYPKAKYKGGIY